MDQLLAYKRICMKAYKHLLNSSISTDRNARVIRTLMHDNTFVHLPERMQLVAFTGTRTTPAAEEARPVDTACL